MCVLYSRKSRSPRVSKWTVHLHFLSSGGGGSTLKCSICKKGMCATNIYTTQTTYRSATLNARSYARRRDLAAHSTAHTDAAQETYFSLSLAAPVVPGGPRRPSPLPRPTRDRLIRTEQHSLNVNRVDCRPACVDGRPPRSDPVFGHLAPPVGARRILSNDLKRSLDSVWWTAINIKWSGSCACMEP